MSLPKFILFFFVMCISVACSGNRANFSATAEALTKQNIPVPKFLTKLEPFPSSTKYLSISKICIGIKYDELWERGDTEKSIVDSLISRIKLTVDGQIIQVDYHTAIYYGPATAILDENKEIIGEIGGAEMCFPISLASGGHIATLQISTTSGKNHSYSWAFFN